MIALALVHTKEAFDFIGVAALVSGGWFSWNRITTKEKKRRIERKEKQAEFELAALRRQREWDEAQRYFGAGVR